MENRQRTYTDAEKEQARDLYVKRGVHNLNELSRLLDIPSPTLRGWRERGEWDREKIPAQPADVNFLLHLIRQVLGRESLRLHDASLDNNLERIKECAYVLGQLSRTFEALAKNIDEMNELNLDLVVQYLLDAAKNSTTINKKRKAVFAAVLTTLHSELMGDEDTQE